MRSFRLMSLVKLQKKQWHKPRRHLCLPPSHCHQTFPSLAVIVPVHRHYHHPLSLSLSTAAATATIVVHHRHILVHTLSSSTLVIIFHCCCHHRCRPLPLYLNPFSLLIIVAWVMPPHFAAAVIHVVSLSPLLSTMPQSPPHCPRHGPPVHRVPPPIVTIVIVVDCYLVVLYLPLLSMLSLSSSSSPSSSPPPTL